MPYKRKTRKTNRSTKRRTRKHKRNGQRGGAIPLLAAAVPFLTEAAKAGLAGAASAGAGYGTRKLLRKMDKPKKRKRARR